jgi:hypothetical protein
MAINARQSTNRQFKSSISNRQSQSPIVNSESTIVIVHLNRQSAVGSRQSAVGSRQSAVGSRQSAVKIVNRQSSIQTVKSAIGSRQSKSPIVTRQFRPSNRQSAIGNPNRQSSIVIQIVNLQSAICSRDSAALHARQRAQPSTLKPASCTSSVGNRQPVRSNREQSSDAADEPGLGLSLRGCVGRSESAAEGRHQEPEAFAGSQYR